MSSSKRCIPVLNRLKMQHGTEQPDIDAVLNGGAQVWVDDLDDLQWSLPTSTILVILCIITHAGEKAQVHSKLTACNACTKVNDIPVIQSD